MVTKATAAVLEAVARVTREAIAEGTASIVRCTVDATGATRETVLGGYDALALAKDLVRNPGFSGVTLEGPDGRVLDEAAIAAARY